MSAFTLAGWDNFFVACSGASAALAGLVFVAMSINLARILAVPGLVGRAGETIIPLTTVLVVSLLALVPGQAMLLYGTELLLFGGFAWATSTWIEIRAMRRRHYLKRYHLVLRLVINQPANLALVLSGLSLVFGFRGGLYWMTAGVILSFGGAMVNAWVLLVEILR